MSSLKYIFVPDVGHCDNSESLHAKPYQYIENMSLRLIGNSSEFLENLGEIRSSTICTVIYVV